MAYRTKTYIAADWDGDKDAVDQLHKWNDSNYWGLHFVDAHELTQARDTSLPCSIKRSLKERLDASKTFILIVGKNTDSVTKGSCRYCRSHSSLLGRCLREHSIDFRSFVEYECETAYRSGLKIAVLYNSQYVYRDRCPEILRNKGTHLAMYEIIKSPWGDYKSWKYTDIKNAIENL